jgi:hypothetical protein
MESNDPSTESSRRYQMWGSLAAVVIGLGVSLAGYPWAAVTTKSSSCDAVSSILD